MAIVMEPVTPWLRDFNQLLTTAPGARPFVPPADVLVSQENVTVYMDVPGLRPDELEIELEQDQLTVRGERRNPYEEADQRVARRMERAFGRFERSLRVPAGLDPATVQAALAAGVLTLNVPRPQPPQPKRIQIGAGEQRAQQSQETTAA
jgi:HSP20 family protein